MGKALIGNVSYIGEDGELVTRLAGDELTADEAKFITNKALFAADKKAPAKGKPDTDED